MSRHATIPNWETFYSKKHLHIGTTTGHLQTRQQHTAKQQLKYINCKQNKLHPNKKTYHIIIWHVFTALKFFDKQTALYFCNGIIQKI
jgi:hypothetical protein